MTNHFNCSLTTLTKEILRLACRKMLKDQQERFHNNISQYFHRKMIAQTRGDAKGKGLWKRPILRYKIDFLHSRVKSILSNFY